MAAAFTVGLLLRPASRPEWDATRQATAARVPAMIPDDADAATSNRLTTAASATHRVVAEAGHVVLLSRR
ncbi:MAG: hypothetical protein HOV94_12230 [Saccharothrix sp.]|nr:hypothetical protein [Saccharothrix sp.]